MGFCYDDIVCIGLLGCREKVEFCLINYFGFIGSYIVFVNIKVMVVMFS